MTKDTPQPQAQSEEELRQGIFGAFQDFYDHQINSDMVKRGFFPPVAAGAVDTVMKLVYSWHTQQVKLELNDRAKYNKRVQVNVEAAAQADGPVEWTEPVSGKKLLNEAAVTQQVEAATKAARADQQDKWQNINAAIGRSHKGGQ